MPEKTIAYYTYIAPALIGLQYCNINFVPYIARKFGQDCLCNCQNFYFKSTIANSSYSHTIIIILLLHSWKIHTKFSSYSVIIMWRFEPPNFCLPITMLYIAILCWCDAARTCTNYALINVMPHYPPPGHNRGQHRGIDVESQAPYRGI